MLGVTNFLALAGGLGLFLFALRFLTSILDRSIANRFRPLLSRLLATPWRCGLAGFVLTLLVQASSITIITAMGLVNSSLIALEQAVFVMLGATVGTTVKAWVFAQAAHLGPALVAVASLGYLLVRRPVAREALEVLLAIGLAFLGLDMVALGLAPLAENPAVMQWFHAYDGTGLDSQALGVLIGAVATVAVQSSSAIVFVVLDLASQGLISFPGGAALILGANLGTTITAVIAGAEMDWEGRRLALAHIIAKAAGVLLALLLFPTFLGVIGGLFTLVAPGAGVVYRLAAAHTGFNLANAFFWGLFSHILLRVSRSLTPPGRGQAMALPVSVRRMLAGAPERALAEADRQAGQLQLLAKSLTDDCFLLLLVAPGADGQRRAPLVPKDLANIKEGLNDLLFQLLRHPRAARQVAYTQQLLRFTDSCAALYHISLAMRAHLERGLLLDFYTIPPQLRPPLEDFQKAFDTLWLRVLFRQAEIPANDPAALIDAMEQRLFLFLLEHREAKPEHLIWLYDMIGFFRQLARQLRDLHRMKALLDELGGPVPEQRTRERDSGDVPELSDR